MVIAGDIYADVLVISATAKVFTSDHSVDLEKAFSIGRGDQPSNTCTFDLDAGGGTRRDFVLVCPIALAASESCAVLPDRWIRPHFSCQLVFRIGAWEADVQIARSVAPLPRECSLSVPDKSSKSSSQVMKDIWAVYLEVLQYVPQELRDVLYDTCYVNIDLDKAWLSWCGSAEEGLLQACHGWWSHA